MRAGAFGARAAPVDDGLRRRPFVEIRDRWGAMGEIRESLAAGRKVP